MNQAVRKQNDSPQLKPIEEVSNKKEGRMMSGASNTQNRFFVQKSSQQGRNQKKQSRNYNFQQRNSDLSQQQQTNNPQASIAAVDTASIISLNNSNITKTFNITSDKFFPQNTKQLDKQNFGSFKSECMSSSLEFLNSSENNKYQIKDKNQTQHAFKSRNVTKKGPDMIREEQYEECVSEEEQQQQSPLYRKQADDDYNRQNILISNAYDDNQEIYTQTTEQRINIKLRGGRALNNKFKKGQIQQQPAEYVSHSQPRYNQYGAISNNNTATTHDKVYLNEHQSSQTTSSAASLTVSKQNIATINTGVSNSISPKPSYKWNVPAKDQNIGFNQSTTMNNNNLNNIAGNGSKIAEMQKEVNLMYLGGISQKKKINAGIKLNPINKASQIGSGGQNYSQNYQML